MKPLDLFSAVPTIETQRVLLRKITTDDTEAVFDYAKDPEVSPFLPWEPHKTIEDSRAYIATVLDNYAKGTTGTWAIQHKDAGTMIGAFAYHGWIPTYRRADFGYVIGRAYWNHGIMTEILRRMLQFGFEAMDLNRIEATCDDLNIGSWRVMEKCGMKQEGFFRQHMFYKARWRDTRLYAILAEDVTNPAQGTPV